MGAFDSKTEIDRLYAQVSVRADELYYFVNRFNEYINQPRDYDGSGEKFNMAEIHILTLVADQPGITASQILKQWGMTKGAISQNLKKLEKKELIYRQKGKSNAKTIHIYPTKRGEQLSIAHKSYDVTNITGTSHELLKRFTSEEIDIFYKVVHEYIKLI